MKCIEFLYFVNYNFDQLCTKKWLKTKNEAVSLVSALTAHWSSCQVLGDTKLRLKFNKELEFFCCLRTVEQRKDSLSRDFDTTDEWTDKPLNAPKQRTGKGKGLKEISTCYSEQRKTQREGFILSSVYENHQIYKLIAKYLTSSSVFNKFCFSSYAGTNRHTWWSLL